MSELEERITTSEWQYAKQQRKWFRRDSRIKWFEPTETEKIEKEVEKFLE